MSVLIDKIRIKNFRALKNVEVNLNPITILVGANNSGKTTLLRALNSVLGMTRNQITSDDLFRNESGQQPFREIIIDIRIIPVDANGSRQTTFDQKWSSKLGGSGVVQTEGEREFSAIRTKYVFGTDSNPVISHYLFANWENEQLSPEEFRGFAQIRSNIKMYFIDAQRDILDDSKQRTSFFGKLVAQLDYGEDLEALKEQIASLNEAVTENSPVLSHLRQEFKKLNETTYTQGEGVSLNPLPKKISDLHKGMKVYFQDSGSDSFSMENHGMGTRSWASIITAGAFSAWQTQQVENKIERGEETDLLFAVFALEEPEAHLHPNAQRTLYKQLKDFEGQKIISTHSPYVAGQAELEELRHFYKNGDESAVNELLFDRLERESIKMLKAKREAEGNTAEANRRYHPEVTRLKRIANQKLSEDDRRDLMKEIFLNKGELLFSRALILFEGMTEGIALPIFYQKYFGRRPYEDGVTLVGVGGKNNYAPFLKFTRFLNMPAFILSDGDGQTEAEVNRQLAKVYEQPKDVPLFTLPNQADFEKFLVDSGYAEEIKVAIDKVESTENYLEGYINKLDGENALKGRVRDYKGAEGERSALLDCMKENKTRFAEAMATEIINAGAELPPKLKELFASLSERLGLNTNDDE